MKVKEKVARPERFELPTFWFVDRSSKTSKCRYWYRLRAKRATLFCPYLDGSWTANHSCTFGAVVNLVRRRSLAGQPSIMMIEIQRLARV